MRMLARISPRQGGPAGRASRRDGPGTGATPPLAFPLRLASSVVNPPTTGSGTSRAPGPRLPGSHRGGEVTSPSLRIPHGDPRPSRSPRVSAIEIPEYQAYPDSRLVNRDLREFRFNEGSRN